MADAAHSFKLLDGTLIPWLAWGSGSGRARHTALESGIVALQAGFRHIDTAQLYKTEVQAKEAIEQASVPRSEVYITSKLSFLDDDQPVPLDQVRGLVEETTRKLGSLPDLFLIHNPFVPKPGELRRMWKILEDLKTEGKLKSIGVSNFRVQDLEEILKDATYIPVINQIEFHPYVLSHLEPLLALQAKHGIRTASFGPLTPLIRHPTGGPLKPVLQRIAERLSKETGKHVDEATVLLLWTRAQGVIGVTSSSSVGHIKELAAVYTMSPDLLHKDEIEEITRVGRTVHFRHYREHMEVDFPLPNLPDGR